MKTFVNYFFLIAMISISSVVIAGEKVPVEQASRQAKIDAIETYRGQVIKTFEIKKAKNKLSWILAQDTLETVKGDIYYPEEIEFVIQKPDSMKLGASKEKAPHQDD